MRFFDEDTPETSGSGEDPPRSVINYWLRENRLAILTHCRATDPDFVERGKKLRKGTYQPVTKWLRK